MDRLQYDLFAEIDRLHWWFRARRQIARVMLRQLCTGAQPSILDIGTGSGGMIEVLSEYGRLTTFEPDSQQMEITAEKYRHSHPAVQFITAERGLDSLAPESFDLVTAFDVLEHCSDHTETLLQWSNLLKPNGRMLITVPAFPSLWGANDELSHHYRRYTKATLTEAFTGAGLNPSKISYINAFSFIPVWLSRKIKEPVDKLLNPNRTAPWDFSVPSAPINLFLEHAFACEKYVLPHVDLPIGTSLVAIATRSPISSKTPSSVGALARSK